jgi:ribonucleoside-diphosphate reductase alpha chain
MKHLVINNARFEELYVKFENDRKTPKKKIKAMDLFSALLKERAETGTNTCNEH